jgi:hypothetical protein
VFNVGVVRRHTGLCLVPNESDEKFADITLKFDGSDPFFHGQEMDPRETGRWTPSKKDRAHPLI